MKLNPDRAKSPEQLAWENGYGQGFANAKAMCDHKAAQPLTDEQIVAALKNCEKTDHTQDGWIWRTRIKWARAIEAAHGIGATIGEQR